MFPIGPTVPVTDLFKVLVEAVYGYNPSQKHTLWYKSDNGLHSININLGMTVLEAKKQVAPVVNFGKFVYNF